MAFYDKLETRDPQLREEEQLAAVRAQISHAQQNAPYFARVLERVDARDIKDRATLAQIPLTRKAELIELQKSSPPFAGMTSIPMSELEA